MITPEEMALVANNYSSVEKNADNNGGEKPYELLFDSDEQATTSGLRNSVVAARQLLFRIGPIFVDVEVGRESDSDRAMLVGQMLDSSNPGHPPVGVPVVLLDRGRRVANTSSNDHGEFRLQFVVKSNLKLSVQFDREKPVHLPITSPAGKKVRTTGRAKKCEPLASHENRSLAP
jgi:hypothetical protein